MIKGDPISIHHFGPFENNRFQVVASTGVCGEYNSLFRVVLKEDLSLEEANNLAKKLREILNA